jgi:molecular chaperone GrpE
VAFDDIQQETVVSERIEEEVVQDDVKEPELSEQEKIRIELETELAKLTEEIASIKKAAADITNRNKQLELDKKYAASDLVRNLLVPISYFEGALKFKSEDEQFNNFLKGFEMIYNLLIDQLVSSGLKEITVSVGDAFDPKIHEVMELIEREDVEPNTIVDVMQKGYYFKDRVLKPVKVNISKAILLNSEEIN